MLLFFSACFPCGLQLFTSHLSPEKMTPNYAEHQIAWSKFDGNQ